MDISIREFSSMKSLPKYLDTLKTMENCLIVYCVKDNAGYWLDENIQSQLNALGLKESLVGAFMVGYIAVTKNNELVYEAKSAPNGSEEYSGEVDGHQLHVISKPFDSGNFAAVEIDGTDYAINTRGLNIVVYDLEKKEVIDSVAFDTHLKNFACSRLKKHYDIGVVGCWWGSNYGSLLNGYAVYSVLKSLGQDVLMINKPNASRNDWEFTNTHNAKFIDKFYPGNEVSPCYPFVDAHELDKYCDTFLSGSDQIWNYNINSKFDMTFMLNFVDDAKKKISFGTSFGHGFDKTPKDKLPESIKMLQSYNAISVREKSGVDICNEVYGVKASTVVEPVFCLETQEYYKIAEMSDLELPEEPYILTYILDPTPQKRRAIQYYSEVSGMKAYNVLDGSHAYYEKNKANLNLPNTMGKIATEDFMKLYTKAKFVITDSFHGTAFSIIFNKPFLSIRNLGRGAVRFNELLGKFGLTDRLVNDPKTIPEDITYFSPIDFTYANEVMARERAESIDWLRKVVETPLDQMPSNLLPDRAVTTKLQSKMCVGCGACISSCPTGALSFVKDAQGYYRSKNDYDKCINCGKCSAVCPALQLPENTNKQNPDCYALIAADEEILMKSSSGGAFSLLAEETFKRGGVVVGAAWNEENLSVEHIIVENREELYKLRKSKYVQSYIGDIFKRVKERLDNGTFVLFTGCPCQVTGLKAYLKKDYDNLILVDIFCTYAPSVDFFKKYVDDSFDGIQSYEFRYKEGENCWNCVTIKATDKDGKGIVRKGGAEDDYQRVYHNHTMTSVHCEKCKFQSTQRFGDISLGDFWGISKKDPALPSGKGVSCVLINNKKGEEFFNSIPEESLKVKKETPVSWVGGNGLVGKGKNYASEKRNDFYQAINEMPFGDAVNYALKPNHGIQAETMLSPLNFRSKQYVFKFDPNVWEEHNIKGKTVLVVKRGQSRPGRFAMMPLNRPLEKGKTYTLYVKFRVKTNSDFINFHIKDSGSNSWQIIHYCKLSNYDKNGWIEISKTFVPNSNIYDEFMIGASQIIGDDAYIAFDSITIK